jgi:hypothetical protein
MDPRDQPDTARAPSTVNPPVRDFESPFSEEHSIEHRGASKFYRFTELTEEQAQKIFDASVTQQQFPEMLVLATVADIDGTAMTPERLKRMPRAIVTKLQLKALEVNGYGESEAPTAGES